MCTIKIEAIDYVNQKTYEHVTMMVYKRAKRYAIAYAFVGEDGYFYMRFVDKSLKSGIQVRGFSENSKITVLDKDQLAYEIKENLGN